jgi:hypothetical protein
MKLRDIAIFTGQKFAVPRHIQRIDSKSTHGWQLRYHGTKMFSDHSADGSGASQALVKAATELVNRIAKLPVTPSLRTQPSASKTTNLPRGISGPIVRNRGGSSARSAHFSVLLPRFGAPPSSRTIHIASESNYSVERYKAALAKAVAMRQAAEVSYERAAASAKRKAAAEMKAILGKSAAMR